MQRWGRTAAGTMRWRCAICGRSGVRRRPDRIQRAHYALFCRWLTGNTTKTVFAAQHAVSRQALHAWFADHAQPPTRVVVRRQTTTVIVDATRIAYDRVLLIALNAETNAPIGWTPAIRESYESWRAFLAHLPQEPRVVVSDGHKGLLKSLRERWPHILLQRCMTHVIRDALTRLTRHPRLHAGQALRQIVCALAHVKTRRQKRRWIRTFHRWQKRWQILLREKTWFIDGRWQYTHRSLRRASAHIANAVPDLFRYISHQEIVPRTSNKLEGGINAPIKDLIRKHRGLRTNMKIILASEYLSKRIKKPTRNFT